MVHLRFNEKETNPNPYINFITALPPSGDEHERARQLLRALAAQVKPVMKAHGFTVNSFEEVRFTGVQNFRIPPGSGRALSARWNRLLTLECFFVQYEWNTVFAGRNWNAGETIGE